MYPHVEWNHAANSSIRAAWNSDTAFRPLNEHAPLERTTASQDEDAAMITFSPGATTPAYVAGLDIGGTKMAATVAGPGGIVARVVQPTARIGHVRALPEQAIALIGTACATAGLAPEQLGAVGVASCGPFVRMRGRLALAAPNLCGGLGADPDLPNDWQAIPLEEVLHERFERVVIENDCVAALAAERRFGAARDEQNCVYATWSTGIGFGLCVDGHLLRGKNGNAGHGGHMLMSEHEDAPCGCGNRGDLEGLVSGRNLVRGRNTTTAMLFDAARAGDAGARAAARRAARWFGRALYNFAVTLDTRTFVIGGSVWEHHGAWLEPIVRGEIESRLPALTAGVRVMPAALGAMVVDVGALCLVAPANWDPHWHVEQA
jgi:glucokinase